MNNFYVNINNSYTTIGSGTNSSPFNFTQFLSNISSGLQNNTTYYIEGLRSISADENIDIYINTLNNNDVDVILTNKLKEPWVITGFDVIGNQNVITISTGNILDDSNYISPKSLTIKNFVLSIYNNISDVDESLKFDNIDGRLDTTINIDNSYLEVVK